MPEPVLVIQDLHVKYGGSHVLRGVSLVLDQGVVAIVGRNGMGKTTLVSAIIGLTPAHSGAILFFGNSIMGLQPYQIASQGIGYVPQGRRIFTSLTVDEHLRFAARKVDGKETWDAEKVYDLFPRLKERRRQSGSSLSGGEQQMLAIGRALVINPRLLVMDEPSEGLAPIIVDQLVHTCKNLMATGISILLVEQRLAFAASIADRVQVMVTGKMVYQGDFSTLLSNSQLTQQHLGVGG